MESRAPPRKDFVLYGVPEPFTGESMSSWMMRIALAVQLRYEQVEWLLGYSDFRDPDFFPSAKSVHDIARITRKPVRAIDELMTSTRSALHLFDIAETAVLKAAKRPGFWICQGCLNELRVAHWPLRWRFVSEQHCVRHGRFDLPLLYVEDLVRANTNALSYFRIRPFLRHQRNRYQGLRTPEWARYGGESDFAMLARLRLKMSPRDAVHTLANADVFFPPEWRASTEQKLAYIVASVHASQTAC
jgi:hypothetical protein